jgi:hypothetical protein
LSYKVDGIADTVERILPMRFINGLVYVSIALVSIFQVFATAAGVAHFTGWNTLVCWLIAVIFGWTPLIGTVIGVYGAITTWNWPWYGAVTLFAWPIILAVGLIGIAVVQSRTT